MLAIITQAAAAFTLAAAPAAGNATPVTTIRVDSARHTVTVVTGPHRITPATYGHDHHRTATEHVRFDWPVEGWVRGFALSITDAQGRPLDRALLHHLAVVNFGRRQLLKPTPERMVAFGQETSDMLLPRTVGIPMQPAMPLAVSFGWYNAGSATLEGVRLEITIHWLPRTAAPRPMDAYPVSMDVSGAIGEDSGYDLPPGRTRQSIEFTMPVGGRIIAAGGHLHDFGTWLRVSEVRGDRRHGILQLASVRDDAGRVSGIERATPGIGGTGIRLRRDATYELAAENANPTGRTLANHAMAYVAMLFAPDRGSTWPALDTGHPAWQKELGYLFGAP